LRDLLRATASLELRHHRRLRIHLRLRLGKLRHEAAGVEAGDHLALLDSVALLDQHARDAAAVVERERYLAHLDVAVEDDVARPGAAAVEPPPGAAADGDEQDHGNCDEAPVHGSLLASIAVRFSLTTRLMSRRWRSPSERHSMRLITNVCATRNTR